MDPQWTASPRSTKASTRDVYYPDHDAARGFAHEITAGLIDAFEAEFGAVECRTLLGRDIRTPEAHAAFLESGAWRTTCMRQVEFAVGRLAALAAPADEPR